MTRSYKDEFSKATKAAASKARKHGYARRNGKTPEYRIWRNIITRCCNPNRDDYADYGGRGIKVCALWKVSFVDFFAHVGPRPSPKHSIDRIDNAGNYEPGNVRWATHSEQAYNRRRAKRKLRVLCGTDTAYDIAEKTGVSAGAVRARYAAGYRGKDLYGKKYWDRRA